MDGLRVVCFVARLGVSTLRMAAHQTARRRFDETEADKRIARVLWNDPGTGVMRHADAGYEIAIDCAREQGLDLPMVTK